jgi:hypothetical protein
MLATCTLFRFKATFRYKEREVSPLSNCVVVKHDPNIATSGNLLYFFYILLGKQICILVSGIISFLRASILFVYASLFIITFFTK